MDAFNLQQQQQQYLPQQQQQQYLPQQQQQQYLPQQQQQQPQEQQQQWQQQQPQEQQQQQWQQWQQQQPQEQQQQQWQQQQWQPQQWQQQQPLPVLQAFQQQQQPLPVLQAFQQQQKPLSWFDPAVPVPQGHAPAAAAAVPAASAHGRRSQSHGSGRERLSERYHEAEIARLQALGESLPPMDPDRRLKLLMDMRDQITAHQNDVRTIQSKNRMDRLRREHDARERQRAARRTTTAGQSPRRVPAPAPVEAACPAPAPAPESAPAEPAWIILSPSPAPASAPVEPACPILALAPASAPAAAPVGPGQQWQLITPPLSNPESREISVSPTGSQEQLLQQQQQTGPVFGVSDAVETTGFGPDFDFNDFPGVYPQFVDPSQLSVFPEEQQQTGTVFEVSGVVETTDLCPDFDPNDFPDIYSQFADPGQLSVVPEEQQEQLDLVSHVLDGIDPSEFSGDFDFYQLVGSDPEPEDASDTIVVAVAASPAAAAAGPEPSSPPEALATAEHDDSVTASPYLDFAMEDDPLFLPEPEPVSSSSSSSTPKAAQAALCLPQRTLILPAHEAMEHDSPLGGPLFTDGTPDELMPDVAEDRMSVEQRVYLELTAYLEAQD